MQLNKNKKSSSITLAPQLDAYQADALQEVLVSALAHGQPVTLKAADVTQLDTACAQVLAAAHLACQESSIDFTLQSPSPACEQTLQRLGLFETLTTAGK